MMISDAGDERVTFGGESGDSDNSLTSVEEEKSRGMTEWVSMLLDGMAEDDEDDAVGIGSHLGHDASTEYELVAAFIVFSALTFCSDADSGADDDDPKAKKGGRNDPGRDA